MDFGFKNKHVFITGSNGGIGFTTAKQFLEQGAFVTLHYNRTLSDELSTLQKQYLSQAQLIQANATNEEQVIKSVDDAVKQHSPIDILILNHGIFPEEDIPITDMTLSQWSNTLNVNLTGYFLFARQYLRQLKSNGSTTGSIVMVGSTSGIFGEYGHADYSCSKSALTGLL